MKTYEITINRISSRTAVFIVQAENLTQAEAIAMENAYNHDYNQESESSSDYEIVSSVPHGCEPEGEDYN